MRVYSGSAAASSICTARRSKTVRPAKVPRPGTIGLLSWKSLYSGGIPNEATIRQRPPCSWKMKPDSAMQIRAAVDERIEHWPELGTRLADDLENLGGRGELLDRVITLAGELCDLGVFAGNRSTAFARWLWRAPLRLVRWLRLRCLKARGPTPFHLGPSLGGGPQPSTAAGELCSTAKLGRLRRLRVIFACPAHRSQGHQRRLL